MKCLLIEKGAPKPRVQALIQFLLKHFAEDEPRRGVSQGDIEGIVKSALSGRSGSRFLALFERRKVAGVILFSVCSGFSGDWISMHEILIRRDLRRKGLGALMGRELKRWGLKRGYRYLAGITDRDNAGLLALGEHFGMARKPVILLEGSVPR